MRTPIHRRPCGHRDCAQSMHKNLYLTYGRGALSQDGHWEIPCRICAAQSDNEKETVITQTRNSLMAVGREQEAVERYIQETPWLHNPAWPFVETEEDSLYETEQIEAAIAR